MVRAMTLITLELDDSHLAAASRALDTASPAATVTAALAEVALRGQRDETSHLAAAERSLAGHYLG